MSTGLVEPGLFLRPRRLALISSLFTRSSDWCGNATSCTPLSSLAQNTMILYDLSSLHRCKTGWSLNLNGMVTEFLCCAMAGDECHRLAGIAMAGSQGIRGSYLHRYATRSRRFRRNRKGSA